MIDVIEQLQAGRAAGGAQPANNSAKNTRTGANSFMPLWFQNRIGLSILLGWKEFS
jgi:hypothetical protein